VRLERVVRLLPAVRNVLDLVLPDDLYGSPLAASARRRAHGAGSFGQGGMRMRAAIVGAGLAGLTAGYRLQSARMQVDGFEAPNSPGGRVQTVRRDGYAIDTGASALGSTYHSYMSLAREVGIAMRPTAPHIGIRRAGATHLLDMDRMVRSGLTTPLLSLGAK